MLVVMIIIWVIMALSAAHSLALALHAELLGGDKWIFEEDGRILIIDVKLIIYCRADCSFLSGLALEAFLVI